ncbi:Fic family protein [Mollicutes bacterium LVI A0078]|nr:Fic family protein [Mollicutes bacterium LVI A0075]WOO91798.1 Fic family protein [Mollicutes bacterium LVI A0078]
MILDNKLGITDAVLLAAEEEKLSKQKAIKLFDDEQIKTISASSFQSLSYIHHYLFEQVYGFAGEIREVNIANGNTRFAPVMYLTVALENINLMQQDNFDQISEKYVEMNMAHPFREGSGRSMRIWLDLILKQNIKQVIDWSNVDKEDYLFAMERSPIRDTEIKHILGNALTSEIDNPRLYMKGINHSYYYEGYNLYDIHDL